MKAGDIMHQDVKRVPGDATFAEAARAMGMGRVSSSVTVVENDRPIGIVTERDMVRLVADGLDPSTTRVGGRMTTDLATVDRHTDLAEAARIMGERRIRHLPVVDNGRLVGIVSMRDLIAWALEELTGGHELADFQGGSAALAAAVESERPA